MVACKMHEYIISKNGICNLQNRFEMLPISYSISNLFRKISKCKATQKQEKQTTELTTL